MLPRDQSRPSESRLRGDVMIRRSHDKD